MSTPEGDSTEARLLEYAREFLEGYNQAIDNNYPDVRDFIREAGLGQDYLSLYGRELGVNVAVAALFAHHDFYLFFLDKPGVAVEVLKDESLNADIEFARDWTFAGAEERRFQKVKRYLGIEDLKTVEITPYSDVIALTGANLLAHGMHIGRQGRIQGTGYGNQAAEWTEGELPEIKEQLQTASTLARILVRYLQLTQSEMSPQARGQEFEKLWRDVLDHYGWRPKKIRIPGEDNDFTAIYQGLHILGEVRWFKTPMTGAKMREFLAKLDPRPQTIGMFISLSGVDRGGMAVVRRAVNTKTVVIFDQADIEKVIFESADPGPIFDEKLRDAYDYIFETTEGS